MVFAFTLHNDFAGYTSIARGLSALLGIELSPNFAQPFFARSFGEFWNRWHISLSVWLRDYVFFPLRCWMLRKRMRRTDRPAAADHAGQQLLAPRLPVQLPCHSLIEHHCSTAVLTGPGDWQEFRAGSDVYFLRWTPKRQALAVFAALLVLILFAGGGPNISNFVYQGF